jgi:hypothetical protein
VNPRARELRPLANNNRVEAHPPEKGEVGREALGMVKALRFKPWSGR